MPTFLLTVLAGLGWRVTEGLRTLRRTERVAIDLGRTLGEIQQLDLVRRASVRLAASTQDPSWERRYRLHHSALEAVIGKALASPMSSAALAEVVEANQVLVRFEAQALLARGQGDPGDATALLDAPDYAAQQRRFDRGLELALATFRDQSREAVLTVRRALLVEAGGSAVLLGVVLLVLQAIIQRLRRSAIELTSARDDALGFQRARDELLSNVSHELRTPLNGVLGSVELMGRTALDGEQRELLETMRDSGLTMLGLVEGLLDFADVEAGRIELSEDEVDLRRIVDGVQDLFAPQARAKGLEFTCLVGGEVPPLLEGDPLRLRQVLMQLVSNAVKYTDLGGVSVRADLESHHKDRVTVRFHVKDSGVGIDAEVLEGLFAPFEQLDGSSTRKHGGTGLGLALARGLAELMGGAVTVRSELGVGSVFTFTCVLRTRPGAPARTPSLEGHWVLLLDDGSANMRTAWELLLTWGAPVDRVEDVSAALQVLRGERPYRFVVFDLAQVDAALTELCGAVGRGTAIGFLEPGTIPPAVHEHLILLDRPVRQSELLDRIQECLDRAGQILLPAADARDGGLPVLIVEANPVNQRIAQPLLQGL
ncbi:MAG: ATP-binding protein, partial [Planctomycetota bacterium]|nr:ATP-binding protein [Planctomycetota bacterium]